MVSREDRKPCPFSGNRPAPKGVVSNSEKLRLGLCGFVQQVASRVMLATSRRRYMQHRKDWRSRNFELVPRKRCDAHEEANKRSCGDRAAGVLHERRMQRGSTEPIAKPVMADVYPTTSRVCLFRLLSPRHRLSDPYSRTASQRLSPGIFGRLPAASDMPTRNRAWTLLPARLGMGSKTISNATDP